jgi:membrane associated rhomboid family serine protease
MATCYRHPGRETNVACSNCGRPICPDCMTTTPVGMRCPECSRERTQVRRVGSGFASGAAPATTVLIGINVLVFLAMLAAGGDLMRGGGELSDNGALYGPNVADGEWYRVITGGFLHAGIIHLGLNCFVLFILGRLLEPAIGSARFVGIYAVSLLGGSLGALVLDPNEPVVGASGAVFGVMAAAFLIARQRGFDQLASQIGFLVILNLVFTFRPGISVGGHVGGLITGAILAVMLAYLERSRIPQRGLIEAAAFVVLGALAFAGALVAADASNPLLVV